MVDRLEELGVAERRGAEGDRRATLVDLTDEGRSLMRGVAEQRLLFYCDVLDALDPEEREQLVNLTAKAALVLRARSEALVGR